MPYLAFFFKCYKLKISNKKVEINAKFFSLAQKKIKIPIIKYMF